MIFQQLLARRRISFSSELSILCTQHTYNFSPFIHFWRGGWSWRQRWWRQEKRINVKCETSLCHDVMMNQPGTRNCTHLRPYASWEEKYRLRDCLWLYRFSHQVTYSAQESSRRRGEQVYSDKQEGVRLGDINCRIACSSAEKKIVDVIFVSKKLLEGKFFRVLNLNSQRDDTCTVFNFVYKRLMRELRRNRKRWNRRLSGNSALLKSIFCGMSCHSLYHPSLYASCCDCLSKS